MNGTMRGRTESITEVSAKILVHERSELPYQRISPVILFSTISTIIVLLCIGSLVSTFCHAASNSPQIRGAEKAQPTIQIALPPTSLKTIIVSDYYPNTFVNDKGIPDGFSVDVAKAVTHVMDLKLEIRLDAWQHATEALSNGAIDLLPMMAYSQERDPFRCKSHEIDLGARILAVCDIFCALTEDRPHRNGMKPENIKIILPDLSANGIQAPRIVKLILENMGYIAKVVNAKQQQAQHYYQTKVV